MISTRLESPRALLFVVQTSDLPTPSALELIFSLWREHEVQLDERSLGILLQIRVVFTEEGKEEQNPGTSLTDFRIPDHARAGGD